MNKLMKEAIEAQIQAWRDKAKTLSDAATITVNDEELFKRLRTMAEIYSACADDADANFLGSVSLRDEDIKEYKTEA